MLSRVDILNVFFPPQCVNCGKWGTWLCPTCLGQVKPSLPECYVCRRLSFNYLTHKHCLSLENPVEQAYVLYRYNKITAKLMWKFKGDGSYRLARFIINTFIKPFEKDLNALLKSSCLVPIPTHRNRFSSRGFSQMAALSHELINAFNFPAGNLLGNVLISTQKEHQAKLSRYARLHEKSKFVLNPHADFFRVKNCKNIVIFDDVMSTGSTVNNAAVILKKIFPEHTIKALVLFRGKPYWK